MAITTLGAGQDAYRERQGGLGVLSDAMKYRLLSQGRWAPSYVSGIHIAAHTRGPTGRETGDAMKDIAEIGIIWASRTGSYNHNEIVIVG
ncbi:hypothetical protein [Streptomyces sp. NPDC020951]|uniref:hypothetical protein n=1 Tax=Streptomyces sp. NPDC020951 TaxID=3365104 RepID=UPI0037963512